MSHFHKIVHRCIAMSFRNGHFGQTHHFADAPKNAFLFLFKEAVVAGQIFVFVHLPVLSTKHFPTSPDDAFLQFGRALQ